MGHVRFTSDKPAGLRSMLDLIFRFLRNNRPHEGRPATWLRSGMALITFQMLACFFSLGMFSDTASAACTIRATRGRFTGKVVIRGGPANATCRLEQSTACGGNQFVTIDSEVTLDAAGNASWSIANVYSGALLVGRTVRLVCPATAPDPPRPRDIQCSTTVVRVRRWFARGIQPGGTQEVQVVLQQDPTHVESWEPGSVWTLRLNPDEATWVASGSAALSTENPGLSASIESVTSSELTFRIDGNDNPSTANTITISGLGINVPSPGTTVLHTQLGLQGDVRVYDEDGLVGSYTFSTPTFLTGPNFYPNPDQEEVACELQDETTR